MKETNIILEAKSEFLKYLRSKFPIYHQSNIFFRDIHYGVLSYLQEHGMRSDYLSAEKVAADVVAGFEREGILKKINPRTWLLIYPDFALPSTRKPA